MVLMTTDPTRAVRERIEPTVFFAAEGGLHKLSFRAMSTVCRVNFQAASPAAATGFAREVLDWVAGFEARYSRFLPGSLISQINSAAGKNWVELDPETDALFDLCQEMVFFTRGVFDPTSTPLLRLWNWKAKPPTVPSEAQLQTARESVGWHKVQRRKGAIFLPRKGMSLDLGGIGKEYAVDRVLTLALERGISNVLVDFGQDVRVHGMPPGKPAWHVGLEDPIDLSRCWTGVAVTNHAVASSGDGARYFEHAGRRYGHIVDPRTGYPVSNGTRGVTVLAPHCTFAGILSTSAFILGLKEGLDLISLCPGVEGCITTEHARNHTRLFHAYTTSSNVTR